MNNELGRDINLTSLIKVTLPTIIMMVFFSLYSVIDGIFISRFVGPDALSATNIIFPIINLIIGISIMLATGGSAIVAKNMGEKKEDKAREYFTLIMTFALIIGVLLAIICLLFIKQIIYGLGSTENLYDFGYTYLSIMLLFTPVIILKLLFDYFLVTAGNPKLGLFCSILGGVTNIILDYLLIVTFDLGIAGAAIATCLGYAVTAIIGLVYFCNKKHTLHFVKFKFNKKVIIKSCTNGSSEMVTQLASAVTTFLYNIYMLKYLGESGVAAITIVLYAQFLLASAILGFTSGVAPRISYSYGSKNINLLKKLIKNSYIYLGIISIASFTIALLIAPIISAFFAGNGTDIYYITVHGFKLFSFSFLLCGINIFTSGMFTALSNGKVSAILSLLRTFVFFILGILILPPVLEVDGVWLVVVFAEILTLVASVYSLNKNKSYIVSE